jgi:hypothetical protein
MKHKNNKHNTALEATLHQVNETKATQKQKQHPPIYLAPG